MTYTFVHLELSPGAYDEIASKLRDAGYDHAFLEGGALDLHGLAAVRAQPPTTQESPMDEQSPNRNNGAESFPEIPDTRTHPHLPLFQSHKRVHALKIERHALIENAEGEVEGATLYFEQVPGAVIPFPPMTVDAAWCKRVPATVKTPDGGYWVRYDDGFESWSPAEAFESGYRTVAEAELAAQATTAEAVQASTHGLLISLFMWHYELHLWTEYHEKHGVTVRFPMGPLDLMLSHWNVPDHAEFREPLFDLATEVIRERIEDDNIIDVAEEYIRRAERLRVSHGNAQIDQPPA